jgi:glutathione peroxidase-family protein
MAVASYGAFPRPLADMPIPTPGGPPIKLGQYRGKVMVVLIVLTTCEHCGHSAEILNGLQKEHSKDFQAIGVAANSEAPKETANFVKTHHLTYPFGYLLDENNIMKLADFKREDHPLSPMYLFVTKKGDVEFQFTGNDDNFFKHEDENVRTLVEGLLKKWRTHSCVPRRDSSRRPVLI